MRVCTMCVVLGLASAALACGGKKTETTTPKLDRGDGAGGQREERRGGEPTTETVEARPLAAATFEPIYFEYDTATLRPEARDALVRIADWLAKNPGATLTIAGHADERGTPEYNIGLGEERAKAARDYLVRLGVAADRLRTISYGEERPAVAGASEAAWSKNRRDEFEVRDGSRASR